MTNGILTAINNETDNRVNSIDFFMVISDGELKSSFDNFDMAKGMVDNINDKNTEEAAEECGRDIEDLSEKELAEMQFMGGYYGENAYIEKIHIDKDLDLNDDYETSNGDVIKVADIKEAYLSRVTEEDILFDLGDASEFDEFDDNEEFELDFDSDEELDFDSDEEFDEEFDEDEII